MTETVKTISPVDGRIYVERPLETAAGIDRALDRALRAPFPRTGAGAREKGRRSRRHKQTSMEKEL